MNNRAAAISIAAAIFALTIAPGQAALPLSWQPSKPLPTNSTLFAATYGNGRFVAVGANRTV